MDITFKENISDIEEKLIINGESQDRKSPCTESSEHNDGGAAEIKAKDTTDAGRNGASSKPPLPVGMARMTVDPAASRYNMGHPHRGKCVIFNHRVFDQITCLGERNGTIRDRDEASRLFEQLAYDVVVYNDLNVAKIKEVIQDLAFGTDHSESDSLVIIFMSHGEHDILYGCDGQFKADILFESFKADLCPSLASKPKIFFIQACRGEGLDKGITLVSSQPKDETDSNYLAYKIPTTCDFLVSWSTVPGHYSWRNTTNGSWFIQSLVHVISNEAGHEDLLSMMTNVNRHMILNFESNCPSIYHMHGKKQAASIVSTLMRKVYFSNKY